MICLYIFYVYTHSSGFEVQSNLKAHNYIIYLKFSNLLVNTYPTFNSLSWTNEILHECSVLQCCFNIVAVFFIFIYYSLLAKDNCHDGYEFLKTINYFQYLHVHASLRIINPHRLLQVSFLQLFNFRNFRRPNCQGKNRQVSKKFQFFVIVLGLENGDAL